MTTEELDRQISNAQNRIDKIVENTSDDAGVIVSVAFLKRLWDVMDEANAHQLNLQAYLNECRETQVQQ